MFLGEELFLIKLLGIIIAILGVSLIANEQNKTNEKQAGSFNRVGIMLAAIAAALYAISTILLEVGVTEVNPIYAAYMRVIAGSVIFVPLFIGARLRGMPQPPRNATKIILVGAFFGMALGSMAYVYVVKIMGATFAAVMTSISPLFALPISVFILKEKFTKLAAIGAILAIIGVILVILGV